MSNRVGTKNRTNIYCLRAFKRLCLILRLENILLKKKIKLIADKEPRGVQTEVDNWSKHT